MWIQLPLKAGCKKGASTLERTHQACARVRLFGVPGKNRGSAGVWYVALGAMSADQGDFERAREEFTKAYEVTKNKNPTAVFESGYKTHDRLLDALERAYHPHVSDAGRAFLWQVMKELDPDLVQELSGQISKGNLRVNIKCTTYSRDCGREVE